MALAPAFALFVALLCLGLSIIATVLMLKVMDSLGGLPGVGKYLAGFARTVGRAITGVCGDALSGVDALVGGTFHKCAEFLDKTWHLIAETPAVLAHVARVVGDHLYTLTGLRALVHTLEKAVHVVLHRFVVIGRELHGIEHGIKVIERDIAKGIGEDVLPRVRHLERELSKLRSQTIPAVEGLAGEAESDAQRALDWVNAHSWLPNVSTLEKAGAAILAAVGLEWLSCRSNPFNRNPNACGALGDLADLLGLIVAIEAALDFDALVHEAQGVAEVTATGIMDVFGLSNG